MYIAEIDDILDKTLDKFMYFFIIENKQNKSIELIDYHKLIKEQNFIKYQKEINILFQYGYELISDNDINKFVTKISNVNLIKELILKYIGYYLFLFIGINYNGKIETFNNNIIEFSRTQSNYKIKINNFFTTESNSNIIKITNLINEFIEYIEKNIEKNNLGKNKDNTKNEKYSKNLQEFLKSYGEENINKLITVYKDEQNKTIIQHNIIKIMIYLNLYTTSEKKEIFNIIETTETSNGEFTFIDVVIPKSSFIEFNDVEAVLEPNEIKIGLSETIYDLINEDYSDNVSDIRKYFTDFDLKIQKLLDTHLIVPIVDDFLLYHKDIEKYVKQDDKIDMKKKKEDTKIKYIINKINTVSDYYKNPTEIKKLFYTPLIDRNGVLVNTYEDLKIITKLKNIIKLDSENNDLLNDLINYRLYPYIPFKEFKHNGFYFNSESTIDVVRNCSINIENTTKQEKNNISQKKFDILQTRIISKNMTVNIVGFAIINNIDNLYCININSFENISDSSENPLQIIKMLLENKIKQLNFKQLNKTELKKNYYWLFDLDKQKYSIPYYDISPNMNKNDVIKIISAYLYDWVIECIINILKEDITTNHPKLITDYIDNFDKLKYKFTDISNPQYSNNINELEYLIYYIKSKKVLDIYDYKEDEFPGLYGNIFKLPIITKKQNKLIQNLKIKPDFKIFTNYDENELKNEYKPINVDLSTEDFETNEHINAVCQHNISWDKIGELKKINDAKYSSLMYEFIQQYVEMSPSQDYICKSCKTSINIHHYINDGKFDNNTQMFVTMSVKLDVPLENFPEYEQFKTSIRSLDKIIERICSTIKFQGLYGHDYTSKSKRKNIIKDTIDIATNHNNYLKKISYMTNKEIRDKYVKLYGINKNISNIWVFEFDNNIFIYSSKDKDFYKSIKFNNIISYIVILLILEINDSQILSILNDKICSYFIYKKIGHTLFDGINIIINKSYDIKPIQNYPILCYLIYIMSCFITKFNIWADTISTETIIIDKKKSFIPIQKSIINTIVELLNTIIHADVEKNYLYELFQNKYYFKLNEIFKNFDLIKKLDKMYILNGESKQQKQLYIDTAKFDIYADTNNIFNPYEYNDLHDKYSKKYCLKRLSGPRYDKKMITLNKISNLTNCISGEFHNYKLKGNNAVCLNCNEIASLDNLIPESEKLIGERYIILYLRKIAQKYCKSGQIHQFVYNAKSDDNTCLNCGYIKDSMITYSDKELFKLYDIVQEKLKNNNLQIIEKISKIKNITDEEILNISKLFNKIVYKYEKYNNDISKSINNLLDTIQKLLGVDIIINDQSHNLFWNIYIIDHDHNENKLNTPIMVYEKDNKFRIVENHPYYKRNVLIFTNTMQKNIKYEQFYDLDEKYFLGYRETNKEYNNAKSSKIKIKINYSIKNMLILIGFTKQQINIRDFYPEIIGFSKDEIDENIKKFNMENFINKIAFRRFNIIKKLGMELKKYINRFKYNYKINIITIESTFFDNQNKQITNTYISDTANNPLDLLYNKYKQKIEKNIVTEKKNNKNKSENKKTQNNTLNDDHIFLKYINIINLYLAFENIKFQNKNDIPKFSESIDYNIILKNDYLSNLTLNYIIDEIIRLIDYNTNKNIKTNIIHFIINLLNIIFNSTFYDISKFNKELNNFYQILYTSEFYLETQNTDFMIDAIDYYSNQEEIKDISNLSEEQKEKLEDEIEDDNEEYDALDVGDADEDDKFDAEGMYDIYSFEILENTVPINILV